MYSFKSFPSMLTTTFPLFLFFTIIIPSSYSARTRFNRVEPPPTQPPQTHQPSMTFLIQDVLTRLPTMINNNNNPQNHLPFSKPLSNFSPILGAIPLSQTSPAYTSPSTQTLGITFPTTAALREELEFGLTTDIMENVYVKAAFGVAELVGKAKGIYVAMNVSEEGMNSMSHMMAMTASFGVGNEENHDDKSKLDSLRFFGLHRRDVVECHVAVIGGTGKFEDANGYATIRVVDSNSNNEGANDPEESSEEAKFLLFNVYLS